MRTMKSFMSSQTYKLNQILFRALSVQLVCMLILKVIPMSLQQLVFFAKLKNGSIIANLLFFPMSYSNLCEIIALAVFVKPYREYVLKILAQVGVKNDSISLS